MLSLCDLMSPQVRLPLVELTERTKAELAAVMAQMCDENAEYIIGKASGPLHRARQTVAG
jgi:hypothetical protein